MPWSHWRWLCINTSPQTCELQLTCFKLNPSGGTALPRSAVSIYLSNWEPSYIKACLQYAGVCVQRMLPPLLCAVIRAGPQLWCNSSTSVPEWERCLCQEPFQPQLYGDAFSPKKWWLETASLCSKSTWVLFLFFFLCTLESKTPWSPMVSFSVPGGHWEVTTGLCTHRTGVWEI